MQKAKAFTKRAGLPAAQSPIVPVVIGEEEATLAASRLLADEGYLAAAIRPPTVPAGSARLRFSLSTALSGAQFEQLLAAVGALPRGA